MQLEFNNCPPPEGFSESLLPAHAPGFVNYLPSWEQMAALAKQYAGIKRVLVIGHGGSVTSFYAMYHALKPLAKREAYFLSTVDPDYIASLKQELPQEDTLVIAISKSGETVTQIEALMHFAGYPVLAIVGKGTPLAAICEKLGGKLMLHPPIGGRYTGFTEVALLPALLCGLDAEGLYRGAAAFYALYNRENLAWRAASILWQLEEEGVVDVFMPYYSHALYPASQLIIQLCHESFGKDGRGQTYFASEAPESQHHTNQRFFGGPKNIAGFFISVENFGQELRTQVPPGLQSIHLKDQSLYTLHNVPLQAAMRAELSGTLEDAKIKGIPVIHASVTSLAPREVGEFIAFWQLYAVYASVLRSVDPFNQPQVENSKQISWGKRLAYKGLV